MLVSVSQHLTVFDWTNKSKRHGLLKSKGFILWGANYLRYLVCKVDLSFTKIERFILCETRYIITVTERPSSFSGASCTVGSSLPVSEVFGADSAC